MILISYSKQKLEICSIWSKNLTIKIYKLYPLSYFNLITFWKYVLDLSEKSKDNIKLDRVLNKSLTNFVYAWSTKSLDWPWMYCSIRVARVANLCKTVNQVFSINHKERLDSWNKYTLERNNCSSYL